MKSFIYTIIVMVLIFGLSNAGIINVPGDQSTLQAGINAAQNGDTVLVADNTYFENINFKGKAITVASHFLIDGDSTHIDSTIINGSQPSHPDTGSVVLFVSGEDTTSILCGFTLTGGSGTFWDLIPQYQSRDGGGILCENSGCKILNNKIVNNSTSEIYSSGGGILAYADSPIPSGAYYVIIEGNEITDNSVTAGTGNGNGGGIAIYCDENINGKIIDNIISNNECFSDANLALGGGLDCYSDNTINPPQIIIKNNNISHNSAISNANVPGTPEAQGGGMRIRGYYAMVQGNNITYNTLNSLSGSAGGGIRIVASNNSSIIDGNIIKHNSSIGAAGGMGIHTSNPFMINNIVAENSGETGGGIVFYQSNPQEFSNNTIFNNQATSVGGGIRIWYSSLVSLNNIIWGNHAPVDSQIHIHTGGNLQAVYCDIQGGWPGEGNIDEDPCLVADSLSNNSPCIGAGTTPCPPYDNNRRMRPYPAGSNPDIGAWESKLDSPIVGIVWQPTAGIIQSYGLEQNYPNPFNPSTTIEFALPHSGFVTLKIYNILGEEMAALVSERLTAGKYKYEWDASDLASGVYFYRLEAGKDFIKTKKLVLLK